VLSQVKLIAEPWDLGEGGYQVGNFPVGWTEWNARYRDAVRRFWRGDGGAVSELATRLAGSSDLYGSTGRRPHASVNFVTAHDGFTLHDLVSYDGKHNEANGDGNRDGEIHNLSWNCGVEGPTDDPAILALRTRQMRNFLATLLLSQGVPMLSMGDEVARTQRGNNNAYCQDNELSWLEWSFTPVQRDLLAFTRHVLELQRRHPVFRRRSFFQGRAIRGAEVKDLTWFDPRGNEMTDEAWNAGLVKALMVRLSGDAIEETDERGCRITDDTFVLFLNAAEDGVAFHLPSHRPDLTWERVLDTAEPDCDRPSIQRADRYRLRGRALAVLRVRPRTTAGTGQ
jgi:glycogen operon protein